MVAGFGVAAVAAFGVAGRIEMFAFMIPMTVGMSLLPFMAQNYGAGRMDRVRTAYKGAITFALGYGLAIAAAFTAAARLLAGFFSKDPEVVDILVRYIRITCFGYGMLEVHRYATFSMTGIHKPLVSAALNTLRLIVLLVPLSLLGMKVAGLTGMFWARLATDLLAGGIGIVVVLWGFGRATPLDRTGGEHVPAEGSHSPPGSCAAPKSTRQCSALGRFYLSPKSRYFRSSVVFCGRKSGRGNLSAGGSISGNALWGSAWYQ